MLEFFSHSNGSVNTKRAVAECLENALSPGDTDCDLIIFYATIGHDFRVLLDEMAKLAPSARIVGCTGGGVTGKEGTNETMRGLAVMAIRGPKEEFCIAAKPSLVGVDMYETGVEIARALTRDSDGVSMVLLFPSNLDLFPTDVFLEGMESVVGAGTPIFGGLATDGFKGRSNFQFVDSDVFERGCGAVGFSDPTIDIDCQANHGLDAFGEPFEVTASKSNRIFELDGKPSWTAMTQRAGLPETVDIRSREAAMLWTLVREVPDELKAPYGSEVYDTGLPFIRSDGSTLATTVCPPGTKLWLAQRNEEKIFSGTDWFIGQMKSRARAKGYGTPIAVFHADCAVRGRMQFEHCLKEELFGKMLHLICEGQDVPWLGLYAGGEITPIADRNWMHAFTSSVYAMYRKP